MADFVAVDPFGFADGEDIEIENSGDSGAKEAAIVNDRYGDPMPDSEKQFNEKNDVTATYKCGSVAGVSDKTIVLGGAGTAGLVATQVSIQFNNNGHCTITVTGHKHGSTAHDATNAYTIALPTIGFGAIDPIGNPASANCQSASWSASILTHVDKLNNQGAFLMGASRGCKIEASAEYVGAAPTVADGWTEDGTDDKTSNSDYNSAALKVHKYQAAD